MKFRNPVYTAIALACAFGLSVVAGAACAQDYPTHPMRVLIGFPAGSGADILGRYFTAKLADLSGQSVIVENKPGANANIALSLVANAKPDGYTILFAANSNMAGSRFLFKELSFDTLKDFVPAASFARIAFVMTVGATSPIKSIAELTAYLKSHQHNRYGVTNQTAILATEYYKQLVGVEATQVQYRTAPEALPDVANGTLDFIIMDGTFAVGPIKQGKIRALAVTTAQRIPTLPDTPTMMEAGVPNYEFAPWWAAYLPAGTPPAIVAKLGAWFNQIDRMDETKVFLERIASVPMTDDSKAADERLKRDIELWAPLVKAAKIEPQ